MAGTNRHCNHHLLHSNMEKTGENSEIIISNTAVTSPSLCEYCNSGYTHGDTAGNTRGFWWDSFDLMSKRLVETKCPITWLIVNKRRCSVWWNTRQNIKTHKTNPMMMINSFLMYVRSPAPLTMYHDAYNTLPIRRETRKIFLRLGTGLPAFHYYHHITKLEIFLFDKTLWKISCLYIKNILIKKRTKNDWIIYFATK